MTSDPPEPGVAKDLEAHGELVLVARAMLENPQKQPLERLLRYFAISLVNSSIAVALLCDQGFGADGVRVARGMFETYVSFCYLLRCPEELEYFLAFDAVARYKRLQYYKSELPDVYSHYSKDKIEATLNAYRAVRKKFTSSKGTVRDRWCRHSLAEMARVSGLAEMYNLFYRHASFLHHADPMGLAMLIDGETLDIRRGPTRRHVGIALRAVTLILLGTLLRYSKRIGAEHSEVFKRIEGLLSGAVGFEGSVLGSLAETFQIQP